VGLGDGLHFPASWRYPNVLYWGDDVDVLVLLLGAGFLLPIAGGVVPRSLLRRYGVVLVVLATVANALWLSLYAFGEDDYTNNGESRWQTHNSSGSHLYYVVALSFELLLGAAAASLRKRQELRLVAACAALTLPFVWFGSALAFDNN
jgi:hypothetical protein